MRTGPSNMTVQNARAASGREKARPQSPLLTRDRYARPAMFASSGLGLLVQLIERDPMELKLHKAALERAGAVVHASTSASDALGVAIDVDVDVLVCDTHLEDADGFALLRSLRRLRIGLAQLPAIAMSRTTDEEEISEALKAGFQIHLVKPIEPLDLVEMVTSITRLSTRVAPYAHV